MSKRLAPDDDIREVVVVVVVHIVAITEDIPVFLEGELLVTEYELLKKMVASGPTERQAEVTKNTPAGEVLRKVYNYSMDEPDQKGAYEHYTLGKSFEQISEIDMATKQAYTIVWYLTE